MMEDKKLNINQPLLSVRRFSSIAASQKNENRKNRSYVPTMRSMESCKTELKLDPMSNTGSVPFEWEHSPGRPKEEANKDVQIKENPPSLPKLPPGRILKPEKKDSDNKTEDAGVKKGSKMNGSMLQSVLPKEELKTKVEIEKLAKKESSHSTDDDDDDSDEAFMDALDTLSRGESSIYNCSASGIESDVKPSGNLSADPKIRDFMMGRFLPAAMAMASEVPQHTSRKHVVKEKPREVKKLANMDNKKVQLRYGPTFLQDIILDNEEEDGMNMRTRSPLSPANRTHPSSSSISSVSETENEPARIGIYEHRSFERSHLAKHQEDKNNSPKLEGSGLYNRLQGCSVPVTPSESSQSSVSEQNNSSSQKKGVTSFKELLADTNNYKNETDSQDSIIEKTLYVDTVYSLPSSIKGQSKDTVADESKGDDMKMDIDKNGFEQPAPPPLPKSPSDSWLWRTLPAVSSKYTPIRWNRIHQSSSTFVVDAKSDFGYSQGPLLPIPET